MPDRLNMLVTAEEHRTSRLVSGFSIIELMVTLSVASILLAIAVPSFTSLAVNSRLITQSNDVVAALNLARSEAIKRNTSVSFCRVSSETAVDCAAATRPWTDWIVTTGNGGNVLRRGVVNTFSGGISMQSTLTGDQVTYRPEGLAYTGGVIVADQRVTVCAPRDATGRRVTLGRGSRLSTTTLTGACGA
ncbi:MAG TPA: GspH/FimT family pseudopilin [Steroidobacter sp.]